MTAARETWPLAMLAVILVVGGAVAAAATVIQDVAPPVTGLPVVAVAPLPWWVVLAVVVAPYGYAAVRGWQRDGDTASAEVQ